MTNRREFLKRISILGAAGAGAHLTRFGLMTANAQPALGYKALVCIFMNGGNDSNNTVIPLTQAGYSAYQAMRGSLALAPSVSQAQTVLRPLAGGQYGLHPRLVNIQSLYNANRAAVVLNVGTLVRPTTKAQYQAGQNLPRNLYSHSDQTSQWQTGTPNLTGGTGWGGRISDVLTPNTAFPAGVSINGNSAFLVGAATTPVSISPGSTFGLNSFGNQAASDARLAGLQQILTFSSGVQLISSANGVLQNAVRSAQEINRALASGVTLTTVFPNTGLGQQLQQVAKIIQVRAALGATRQVFFCSMGGFDNHSNLVNDQDPLLGSLDGAIGAFQTALGELLVAPDVVTFTESEFSRTGNASVTNGSDHAWGGHHFVIGQAVKGGASYGTFPTLALGGPDDTGNRGVFIPTTSLDQYGATMASWFGVSDPNLTTVFPNLNNFAPNLKMAFL